MTTHDRGGLPLPDFDHLPVGALESRIRSLQADELDRLLQYEHEHADRTQVVQLLTSRRHQLDEGAEPTGGDPSAFRPEQAGRAAGGSPVSPATSPQPSSPPPHGTPDQPGKPKGNRSV
ncbi:hypothetical protein [Streptomyces roseolilacinus]|jgi:hypothetical protein|uniref:hypothetical protein n=1 Tax=Streptomyces roseolilacinus TaxID=66904 RepID=UPI003817E9E3